MRRTRTTPARLAAVAVAVAAVSLSSVGTAGPSAANPAANNVDVDLKTPAGLIASTQSFTLTVNVKSGGPDRAGTLKIEAFPYSGGTYANPVAKTWNIPSFTATYAGVDKTQSVAAGDLTANRTYQLKATFTPSSGGVVSTPDSEYTSITKLNVKITRTASGTTRTYVASAVNGDNSKISTKPSGAITPNGGGGSVCTLPVGGNGSCTSSNVPNKIDYAGDANYNSLNGYTPLNP